ncbi:hypothetical protein [Paenibacillus sp. 1P07SE]|uniref:hypothetical protein n=1 Tax=Paenibacillus sp. 1P07SE TaxID=3132209 RepID=UPI0039A40A3A
MNMKVRKSGTRAIRSLLILSLSTGLLAACSTNSNNAPEPADGQGQTAERPTIRVAVQANPNVESYDTNHFTQLIEEAMDVNLEFLELPSQGDEALTKLALMVSSGETLPDVINIYLNEATIYDYAAKGIFVPLDGYLNDPQIAANYHQIPEREYVYNMSKLPDGNVYSLPRYNPFQWNEGANRAWINSAWLEQLNLEIPTTTDELYDVLKAFTTQDPNGNGRQDEVGIVGSTGGWAQNPRVFLMNSFIYADPDTGYLKVDNGKVMPSFTQPEWRAGLEYMNKLVSEGLFSPLSFTQDETQMKALVNVSGGMAGVVPAGSYSVFGAELENNMTLLPPVAGPDGLSATPYKPTLPTQLWFITKDAKDPELAFRVGDFLLDPEMSISSRFGEKGVDWTDDAEVTAQYLGLFEESEGLATSIADLNPSIWNNPQNKHWNDANPAYRSLEVNKSASGLKKDEIGPNSPPNWQPAYVEGYVPAFPEEVIAKLSYTPEELRQIANQKTVIDNYVNESAVAFITGNRPLSQWDAYLAELEKMGLEDYLKVAQAAFDRNQ